MEQSELLAYLRSQRLGVLGTLAPSGEPQAALVGYAITPDFEILFDTLQTTRKYRNMTANPRVSFTIGNTVGHGDERQVRDLRDGRDVHRALGDVREWQGPVRFHRTRGRPGREHRL